MKTKQQLEERLYKSYFIDRKRNSATQHGLLAVLIIAVIVAIKNDKIEETLELILTVFGFLGFLVYCAITIWFFFISYDLDKEITKIYKKIDELELDKYKLQCKFDEKFGKNYVVPFTIQQILERIKITKLQEKIWELEFEIEMLGGPNRISLK